jgi:hypothetical protein
LDQLLPSLNVNRIAGSTIGSDRCEENKFKMSQLRRGKILGPYNIMNKKDSLPKIVNSSTIEKLKLHSKGVIVTPKGVILMVIVLKNFHLFRRPRQCIGRQDQRSCR